ncbi:hypothetical protein [Pseudomonas aeruginosa]|uniref:dioxygenase family protein n=1 Tax=Pseudomonas aeruginosa TaxID=287 RepID=UPI003EE3B8DF
MAYHSSVGCDRRGDQPTGYATPSACFHTPEITITPEADGYYAFRTSKPRHYPIPSDGPVGKLLSRIGRHPHRAAHIHFIVTAPGYDPVTTHIFAPDCPYLREDTVFGVRPDLIATIDTLSDADMAKRFGMKAPFLHINWDFVLQPITPAGE